MTKNSARRSPGFKWAAVLFPLLLIALTITLMRWGTQGTRPKTDLPISGNLILNDVAVTYAMEDDAAPKRPPLGFTSAFAGRPGGGGGGYPGASESPLPRGGFPAEGIQGGAGVPVVPVVGGYPGAAGGAGTGKVPPPSPPPPAPAATLPTAGAGGAILPEEAKEPKQLRAAVLRALGKRGIELAGSENGKRVEPKDQTTLSLRVTVSYRPTVAYYSGCMQVIRPAKSDAEGDATIRQVAIWTLPFSGWTTRETALSDVEKRVPELLPVRLLPDHSRSVRKR